MQGRQSGRRRQGAGFLLLALSLASFLAPGVLPGSVEASASGRLTLTRSALAPALGDNFSATIDLSDAAHIHAFDVFLLYNPNAVQVLDADPVTAGTQVLPGPFPGGGSVTANSAAGGSIRYRYALAGNAETSGGGTIATVQFRVIGPGDPSLGWGTASVSDGTGMQSALSTDPSGVGSGGAGTATATSAAIDTATAAASTTVTATATSTPTTGAGTATAAASATATIARTATVTRTPAASVTARPTSTPRITVLQDSNAPTQTINQKLGVDGAGTKPQSTLPSAGNDGPGTEWWRWSFFAAALMLGIAGWFFTFAIHQTDRDVVLVDRHDRRRRRR